MSKTFNLGDYILDTLQIYFPWDDDLYTEMKKHGLGADDFKIIPLIYSDNTAVTIGKKEKRRKYVINPNRFGKSYTQLGWTETEKQSEPIIPAEKPSLNLTLIDLDNEPKVKLTVKSNIDGKEQYHLEFSSMSAFGKIYSNWATFYLMPKDIKAILDSAKKVLGASLIPCEVKIITEGQQAQREKMLHCNLPVLYYQFCLNGFKYAVEFFKHYGVDSKNIPNLIYDSSDKSLQQIMSPYVKLGMVHTTVGTGFEVRNPQFVMKVAQDKITLSRRGKNAKVKGKIVYNQETENYFLADASKFIQSSEAVIHAFENRLR